MAENSKSQKNKRKSAEELVEELRLSHHNESADLIESLLAKLKSANDQLEAAQMVFDNETGEPADEYMEGRMAALDEVASCMETAKKLA